MREVDTVKQNGDQMQGSAVVQVFAQASTFNWAEPYKVEQQVENRGSGFLINGDGYLITNAHVVNEAKLIWIHLPALGQQIIHAHIVGFCPERDLALLRIDDADRKKVIKQLGAIPFLTFGDSDTIARTDMVLVLGYPLGQFRLKSSTGVVSGRENGLGQALIQITAPVNPGSSGGPLLNVRGEVIGITIAGVFEAQNVGYAIPINELKLILDDLYTQPLVRKPILGAQFNFASDAKAAFLGNPEPSGLYVSRIYAGSPFEKAGVKAGDMLYAFNGFQVDAFGDTPSVWGGDKANFRDLIARVQLGERVEIELYRKGEKLSLTFTMELMPLYPIRMRYPDYEAIDYEVVGGLVVMELSDNHIPLLFDVAPDLVRYERMENKTQSVLVITHVLPGSLAQQLRILTPGDTIEEVNGKRVSTLQDFRRMTKKSRDTHFWTLKTGHDTVAVFSLAEMLADEERLSADFSYPLTNMVKQLIKQQKKS